MKLVITENILPDIIGTGCANSQKVQGVDFKVPCGKCLPCLKKKRSDWAFRLENEYLSSDSAHFITLTYNDIYLPYRYVKSFNDKIKNIQVKYSVRTKRPTLNKKHVQDFIKRLRNEQVKYVKGLFNCTAKEVKQHSKPLRYYLVGEYGTKTQRPHYHVLLFNLDVTIVNKIQDQWKYGFTDIGKVTSASIRYCTKYMFKEFNVKKDTRQRPFSLMSKGRKNTPYGILGYSYLEKNGIHHIETEDLQVRTLDGNVQRMPRAFLKRLFTNKEDRLEISLRSLNDYKAKKVKEYSRLLEKHYNNDHLKYMASKDSDLKRNTKTINNTETL